MLSSLRVELGHAVQHDVKHVITLLARATREKMEDQLARYLYGELSDPTPKQLADAASAPVHNMHAERDLGMMDALRKRAPNADVSFLEAKVKCKQNKTLVWIELKEEDERMKLIEFCVKHLDRVIAVRRERQKKVVDTMLARQRVKGHKLDVTARNKLSKEIQEVLREGGRIEHPVFNELSGEQLEKLLMIFGILDKKTERKKMHIDQLIVHTWWDQDKKEDVVWYGRVVSLKTRTATGDPVIRIAYWKHDENEDNCVDSNILFSKVIADMIYQNLILL